VKNWYISDIEKTKTEINWYFSGMTITETETGWNYLGAFWPTLSSSLLTTAYLTSIIYCLGEIKSSSSSS